MSHFGFRISDFGLKTAILALLTLGSVARDARAEIVLEAKRGSIIARAVIDRNKVDLSGKVTLTLNVEGPDRIEVAPPRPLLSKSAVLSWLVREKGLPIVEKLDKNRSLWKQEFDLSPFEGDPDKPIRVTIELAPLKVKAGNQAETTITFEKTAEIEVETTIGSDRMLKEITDIEPLPPAPPQFTPRPKPMMLVGLAISLVFIVGVFVLILLRRKKPEEIPLAGAPRALRDLALLRQNRTGGAADFARVADIIRLYLEERFQIPAVRLTTAEALARLQLEVPAPFISQVHELLARCDVAKFAGAADSSDCADCIDRAAALVEQTSAIATQSVAANPA